MMSIYGCWRWTERSAVLFSIASSFSHAGAYLAWKRGDVLLEHRWTLRAVAILFGIAPLGP